MQSGTTSNLQAEFDLLADQYQELHRANIAVTGEGPEYFSEYKIADVADLVRRRRRPAGRILDFGSGVGNSIPFFRKYFGESVLNCADVSSHSIEVARSRFPGSERHFQVEGGRIPCLAGRNDLVFSACVFHHIPHEEHHHWLTELRWLTRPGGLLAIYEHNPLNPLTVHAVNTCPLDVNARLVGARALRQRAIRAGWMDVRIDYKVFFPSMLKVLRPLESRLGWLGLGAQYRLTATAPL